MQSSSDFSQTGGRRAAEWNFIKKTLLLLPIPHLMASSDNYTGIQQVSLKLQTPKLQLGSVFSKPLTWLRIHWFLHMNLLDTDAKQCLPISYGTEQVALPAVFCFLAKQSRAESAVNNASASPKSSYYSFRAWASTADVTCNNLCKQRSEFKIAGWLRSPRERLIDNGKATDAPQGALFTYRENGELFQQIN